MERWRRGAKIVAIEPDSKRVYHDGNVYRRQVDMTFDGETFARIKLGYLCLRCLEPHEESFPELCSLCGYGMREWQMDDLAKEMEGEKHVGPSTTLEDEVARLREEKQFAPGSRITVPELWTPDAA